MLGGTLGKGPIEPLRILTRPLFSKETWSRRFESDLETCCVLAFFSRRVDFTLFCFQDGGTAPDW